MTSACRRFLSAIGPWWMRHMSARVLTCVLCNFWVSHIYLVVICSIYTFWCKDSLSATLCWRAPIRAKQLSTVAASEFGHSYVSFIMGQSLIKICDMQMSCALVRDWLVYYVISECPTSILLSFVVYILSDARTHYQLHCADEPQ